MGFLTASYQAFQYADVEAVLQELFAEQYSPRICRGSGDPAPARKPEQTPVPARPMRWK